MITFDEKIKVVNPRCWECRSTNVEVTYLRTEEPPFQDVAGFIYYRPLITCQEKDCQEECIAPEFNRALQNALCKMQGLLTPAEIKEHRRAYGAAIGKPKISQKDYARELGLGEVTIARYEACSQIQNKANDNLIRASLLPEFYNKIISPQTRPTLASSAS